MNTNLLHWLACPACGGGLLLRPGREADGAVWEGSLDCACGETYPIIKGVPRMLLGELRREMWRDYPELAGGPPSGRSPEVPAESAPDGGKVARTRASFGFEWNEFSGMRPEWEKNFWDYMAPKTPEFFRGKLVLDAGCGMGRHLYHAARQGGEVIGVDFSRAVDAAARNVAGLPNAHVVQADLLRLPFRPDTFDFIYSLGVLHHLPSTEAALGRLLEYLKPGCEVRVYLYWSLEDAPLWKRAVLSGVTAARLVTTRLPHRALYWLCYPVAAGAWLTFVMPYKVLSRLPPARPLAEALPLKQYSAYPFGVLLNDQFDRFSAPIERRFGRAEVGNLLADAGLEEVTVAPNAGWLGHGRKREA